VKSSKALGTQIGVSTTEASRLVAAFGRMGIEASSATTIFNTFSKRITASTTAYQDNQLAMQRLQLDIQKTKDQINVTTAEIKKNGDSTGVLTDKLKGLQLQLQQQNLDLTKSADSFQKLGISTVDAQGKQKDFNTILFEVADKFKTMPNGVDKTTLALDLFGRQGTSMIKVLNLGSTGIQDLEKQADKLGLTLNAKTIGAVNGLVQSQKDLKEQTDAMKIAVGTATAPVLTKFNEQLLKVTQTLLNSNPAVKSATTNVLAFGGPVASAGASVTAFLGNISSITPKMGALALRLGLVGIVVAAVAGGVYLLVQHLGGLHKTLDDIKGALDGTNHSFEWLNTLVTILSQYWTQVLLPGLQAVWAALVQNLVPAFEQLWQAITRLWNALNPALMDALKIIGIIIAGALLAALWGLVAALNIVIQVFSFVISVISNVINWIANLIAWFGNLVGVVVNTVKTIIIIFQNLKNGAADAIWFIGQLFAGLGGLILGAVKGFGSLLYNAGKDLVQGLINGINGAIKDVENAVGNVGKAAVNKIKGLLGIHSPSTVFMEIGDNMGQGLINGIAGTMTDVQNAVNDIASPTINAGQAAANQTVQATVASPIAAAGNTTINLDVNVGMYAGMPVEKREIALELWKELVRAARAQGVNLPMIGAVGVQ
jgi:phage-related protein